MNASALRIPRDSGQLVGRDSCATCVTVHFVEKQELEEGKLSPMRAFTFLLTCYKCMTTSPLAPKLFCPGDIAAKRL